MSAAILIAISFSIGFFFESIIGFGGGLIAYSILGFFLDFKDMILSGLYVGTLASGHIILSDHKSFDKKIFFDVLPLCFFGTVFGVMIFAKLSPQILAVLFGILLIILAIRIMFFESYVLPKIFQKKLIFIGGISQGAFGIGGPFFANALKNDFTNKSAFRATMAALFVTFNLVRFVQLYIQDQLCADFFLDVWWTIIPVFVAIKLGHLVHLKISEEFFKKGVAVMTIFAGLKFLSKIFS